MGKRNRESGRRRNAAGSDEALPRRLAASTGTRTALATCAASRMGTVPVIPVITGCRHCPRRSRRYPRRCPRRCSPPRTLTLPVIPPPPRPARSVDSLTYRAGLAMLWRSARTAHQFLAG